MVICSSCVDMNPFLLKLELLLYLMQVLSPLTQAGFVEPPLSFNASQGSNVSFHCRINETGNILFWLINDELSNFPTNTNRSVLIRKEGNIASNLTIIAHPWNQNVEIQCGFHTPESRANCSNELVTCSKKAVLKIQGLLSPPLQLSGVPQLNISVIHLTWSPPPSLNLTGIEPDINHYTITVFNNKTGATENFTSPATEFTYFIQEDDHYVDTCQELVFNVLAVNVVGKGNESSISVALNSAPNIKLTEVENNMIKTTEISCTTRCDNTIAWRLHSPAAITDNTNHPWYERVGRNMSNNNQCTEVIALTPTRPQYVNTVSVQCVAVYVCHMEAQGCRQRLCVSEVKEVSVISYKDHSSSRSTTAAVGKDVKLDTTTVVLIGGNTLFLILFVLVSVVLVAVLVRATANRSRNRSRREAVNNREERIYESPADVARSVELYNTNLELACAKDPGSLYSLATDPCPAYETAKLSLQVSGQK